MARAEAVEMPNCCVVLWPTEGSRRPGASSAWTEVPPDICRLLSGVAIFKSSCIAVHPGLITNS